MRDHDSGGAHEEDARASKEYWNSLWHERQLPPAIAVGDQSLRNHINLKFHAFFRKTFDSGKRLSNELRLAELGCARSVWLPYFSKEFGFQVAGVDYSSTGCDQARAILAREGVDGQVMLADIFSPPQSLLGCFDYVVSFGLVEHFQATDECLRSCAAFLKPGGKMFTLIPNMNGMTGWLQKVLEREVYDVHVPLDVEMLVNAHETAGLRVL